MPILVKLYLFSQTQISNSGLVLELKQLSFEFAGHSSSMRSGSITFVSFLCIKIIDNNVKKVSLIWAPSYNEHASLLFLSVPLVEPFKVAVYNADVTTCSENIDHQLTVTLFNSNEQRSIVMHGGGQLF